MKDIFTHKKISGLLVVVFFAVFALLAHAQVLPSLNDDAYIEISHATIGPISNNNSKLMFGEASIYNPELLSQKYAVVIFNSEHFIGPIQKDGSDGITNSFSSSLTRVDTGTGGSEPPATASISYAIGIKSGTLTDLEFTKDDTVHTLQSIEKYMSITWTPSTGEVVSQKTNIGFLSLEGDAPIFDTQFDTQTESGFSPIPGEADLIIEKVEKSEQLNSDSYGFSITIKNIGQKPVTADAIYLTTFRYYANNGAETDNSNTKLMELSQPIQPGESFTRSTPVWLWIPAEFQQKVRFYLNTQEKVKGIAGGRERNFPGIQESDYSNNSLIKSF